MSSQSLNESSPFRLRAYFSHHKCATGWTTNIIREICFHLGRNFAVVHRPNDFSKYETLGMFTQSRETNFLAYTNADIKYLSDLPVYRGFHVVRDPRDMLVSAYFSHKHSHPTKGWSELKSHREELLHVSKAEGLLREMDFSRPFFEEMYSWDYERPDILEIKMEDLTSQPLKAFIEISHFLNILDKSSYPTWKKSTKALILKSNRLNRKGRRFMPGNLPLFPVPRLPLNKIPPQCITTIIHKYSFKRLSGRKRGQQNVKSHYRKGVSGDWKNHFTEKHIQHFKDRYNDLLIKLGYETNLDW